MRTLSIHPEGGNGSAHLPPRRPHHKMSQSERDVILMSTDVVEGLAKARERLKAGFHATQDEVDEIAILTVAADMIEEMRAYLEGFPAVRRHRRVVTVRVVRARKDPAAERPDPPEPDGQQ